MNEMEKIDKAMKVVTKLSLDKSSQVFSKLIKVGAKIEADKFYFADITDATAKMSEQNLEVIASIIEMEGDTPTKFLFMSKIEDAYALTDRILKKPPGTTKKVDLYVESAIQEVGNIISSAITNVFAFNFGVKLRPSPPVVISDFAGTVFQECLRDLAMFDDPVFIVETKFHIVSSESRCFMFLFPHSEGLEKLKKVLIDFTGFEE